MEIYDIVLFEGKEYRIGEIDGTSILRYKIFPKQKTDLSYAPHGKWVMADQITKQKDEDTFDWEDPNNEI